MTSAPRQLADNDERTIYRLAAATDRLLASVDRLTAADFAESSGVPGRSRALVLAELAVEAKAFTAALSALESGQHYPLYASAARRDREIAALAAQAPDRIADRLAVGSAMLAQHLGGGPTAIEALEAVPRAGSAAGQANRALRRHQAAPLLGPFTAALTTLGLRPWHHTGSVPEFADGTATDSIAAAQIPRVRLESIERGHHDLAVGYRADIVTVDDGPRDHRSG